MAPQHFTQPDYSKHGQQKTRTENLLIVRQRQHAINRCKERFGFDLTIKEYREICSYVKQAQNNPCPFASKIKDCVKPGISIWKVVYNNKALYALWDSEQKRVLTFLTQNMINKTDYL